MRPLSHDNIPAAAGLQLTPAVHDHISLMSKALMACKRDEVLRLMRTIPDGWDAKSFVRLGLPMNNAVGANHSYLFALYQYIWNSSFHITDLSASASKERRDEILYAPTGSLAPTKGLIDALLADSKFGLSYDDLMVCQFGEGVGLNSPYANEGFLRIGASNPSLAMFGLHMEEHALAARQGVEFAESNVHPEIGALGMIDAPLVTAPIALLSDVFELDCVGLSAFDQQFNFTQPRSRHLRQAVELLLDGGAPLDLPGNIDAGIGPADDGIPKNDLLALLLVRPWSQYGPDLHAYGRSLFDRAVNEGMVDVNAPVRIMRGVLPLQMALMNGSLDAAARLIDAGADIRASLERYAVDMPETASLIDLSTPQTALDSLGRVTDSIDSPQSEIAVFRATLMREQIRLRSTLMREQIRLRSESAKPAFEAATASSSATVRRREL